MPELPEVETIRQDLRRVILRKKIISLVVNKKKIIKNSEKIFKKILIQNSFIEVGRRGKLLIFTCQDKKNYLLIHLRMTGQLIYQNKKEITAGGHDYPDINLLPNKHTHVIFTFQNKAKLFFNDQRQFGYLQIVDKTQLQKILNNYGIEPLTKNFTLLNFAQILKSKKIAIKTVLLNQKLIAGIGNIYADEVCLAAKIHPRIIAKKLTPEKIKKLFMAINKILAQAIKHRGTTFSNYVDAQGHKGNFTNLLKAYGRESQLCLVCKIGIIKKIKINGRGTNYCPCCQK